MNSSKRTNAVLMSLMLAFVLTLGAGVVVGMAAGRHKPVVETQAQTTTRPTEPKGPWLPDALELNTDQREKLKGIWTETVQGPSQRANSSKRSQLLKERDEAFYNLLTDEQKQQYKKQMTEFSAKLAELEKEREKAIQEAVERTKLILDARQREKYDQILKEHGPFPHGDHDRQPHGGGQRGHNGPGHGSQRFGEPRTQPDRNGPTTEGFNEGKETLSPATRPE
jgi:flagellar motility protein MotE (MotC chaperone)